MRPNKPMDRRPLYVGLAVILLLSFQNCSLVHFAGSNKVFTANGGGTDGLRFQTFARCPSGQVGIESAILLTDDFQSATLVRKNCQDLSSPQILDISGLQFFSQNSSLLLFNGQIFDQQTNFSTQKITLALCQTSLSGGTKAFVWEQVGNTTNDFGQVIQASGVTTGILNVNFPPQTTPVDYTTAPGQSSQFDLSITNLSAALTYSISGANSTTISNLNCATQTPPPVNDGSASTPTGIPAFPSLLAGYAVRPPWNVAGVDYAVGYMAGTALKDPSTASIPGVTVDSVHQVLTVTANDTTIRDYDFALNNGWGVVVDSGISGTVIENNNFLVGANNVIPVHVTPGAGGITFQYNRVDGGGTTNNGNSNNILSLFFFEGKGQASIQYNLFQFAPESALLFQGANVTPIIQYNLFYTLGTQSTSDGIVANYIKCTIPTGLEQFNTIYQASGGAQSAKADGMEGAAMASQVNSTVSAYTIANNTVLAPGPKLSMSYQLTVIVDPTSTLASAAIQNNYVDSTGAYGAIYPSQGSSAATAMQCAGNISLSTIGSLGYVAGSPITGSFGSYVCH